MPVTYEQIISGPNCNNANAAFNSGVAYCTASQPSRESHRENFITH